MAKVQSALLGIRGALKVAEVGDRIRRAPEKLQQERGVDRA